MSPGRGFCFLSFSDGTPLIIVALMIISPQSFTCRFSLRLLCSTWQIMIKELFELGNQGQHQAYME